MGNWKPSKSKAREFAAKMNDIDEFCRENGIEQSNSSDSYYFFINGKRYRVSNHTIAKSDSGMYVDGAKVRESYHAYENVDVYITAGKTRLIEIYNNLKAGKELDARGYVK